MCTQDGFITKNLCDNVLSKIADFSDGKEQFDDITLLALSFDKFDFDEEFECDHNNIVKVVDSLNKDLKKHNIKEDVNKLETHFKDSISLSEN